MYSTPEITEIYTRNIDMVYRICLMYTKSKYDAEDMSQNVFIRLMKQSKRFENPEHEKAWLIRTAQNQCRDLFKSKWRKVVFLSDKSNDDEQNKFSAAFLLNDKPFTDETLEVVLSLPDKYKTALYLYYYEGYKTGEIAKITRKPESTIRSYLARGRNLLKQKLEQDENFISIRGRKSLKSQIKNV